MTTTILVDAGGHVWIDERDPETICARCGLAWRVHRARPVACDGQRYDAGSDGRWRGREEIYLARSLARRPANFAGIQRYYGRFATTGWRRRRFRTSLRVA